MPQGYSSGLVGPAGHRRIWTSADVHVFYRSDTGLYYAVDWGRAVEVSANADPATVINAAIVYVNGTLGGGQVRILEGTYVLTDSINMANNVILSGEGYYTYLNGSGLANNEHAIICSGDDDWALRDFSISTTAGGGNTIHCIFIEDGCDRFFIENLYILNSDSDAIHIEGTTVNGGMIKNNYIPNCDDNAVSISMDANHYCNDVQITGNLIYSAGQDGVSWIDSTSGKINDNIIYSSENNGIVINLTNNLVVSDNILYSNVYHGISLVNADFSIISGNLCWNNDSDNTATYDGINIDGDSTDNLIEGNYCRTNHRYGIATSGLRTSIVGNYVYNNDRHGIYEDITDCIINDNFVFDNGQDAAGTYHGIYVGGARSEVIGNFCTDPGDSTEDGIFLASGADQVNVASNFCYNLMGDGIELNVENEYCVVSGNICNSNDDHGIVLTADTCEYNLISGNYCLSNGLDGIDVAGEECIINNNYCYGNSQTQAGSSHGIILKAGADRCVVDGNYCNSRGSDQENGVFLADGAAECVISNNYLYNGMGDGIELYDNNNHCLIEGNHCHSNDDYGIILRTEDVMFCTIQNNFLYFNGLEGIEINGSDNSINDNFVYNNGQLAAGTYNGIYLGNAACDRCQINDNWIADDGTNQEIGIELINGASDCLISGNFIYNHMGHGIYLGQNNVDCSILNNFITTNDDNGIYIGGGSLRTAANNNHVILNGLTGILCEAAQCQINNNYIYMNGQTAAATYHGIILNASDADDCQICDNYIADDGANVEDGIQLVDGVINCLIDGNYIRNHMGDGIDLVANNDDCQIKNNYLTLNDDYGVRIRAATCNNNVVQNNKFVGNVTGAISDGGTDTALEEVFMEINDPDYTLGPHPVIRLPDSVNTNLRIQWLAPKEFQELVRVRGVYVCDATGNMDYWDYGQFGKKCLEPWDMHYASTPEAVHAFDYAGSFECISHAGSLTGVAAGDLAGIRIGRGGANAADTINDDCYFLGLEVEYV